MLVLAKVSYCVPQLKNLFLFHYQYLYIKNLIYDNLCMAKRFSDRASYIDDLLTLNNSNFEDEIPNIYPPELTLERTGESDTNLSYLDMCVKVSAYHWWFRHELSKYITLSSGLVYKFILHDIAHLLLRVTYLILLFSCARDCTPGLLLYMFVGIV